MGGGGVVGGEEGVGAVYHPVVSGCVVVGGGEGVVQIVHEGHVRRGSWLPVVGGGDVPRDVVPEVAQGGHPGYPCFKVAVKGIGTLQRQQFHLGLTAQKICADDDVKGVSVEHLAVLSHLLIAQTHGQIDPAPGNGWSDHLQPICPLFWFSGSSPVSAVSRPRLKA